MPAAELTIVQSVTQVTDATGQPLWQVESEVRAGSQMRARRLDFTPSAERIELLRRLQRETLLMDVRDDGPDLLIIHALITLTTIAALAALVAVDLGWLP